MAEVWQTHSERGSDPMVRLGLWIALRCGYSVARALLYPIALYFILFSRGTRRSSADYLGRALSRRAGALDTFRHYHTFAATILDRFYFMAGRAGSYDIRLHGVDLIDRLVAERRGGLLLGSHLGSFDVLRVLADRRDDMTVKALMVPEHSSRLGEILTTLNPAMAGDIIPLGRPQSIMEAHRCLENGEFVGLLADRNTRGEKRTAVPFLGAEAQFPLGPLMLAALADRPVVLFFGLYRGPRHYDVHFELLADRVPKDFRRNPDRLRELLEQYAGRLEAHCRSAPYNWFNFYDFWSDGGA